MLDFRLPHEFGGLGEPIEEKYKYINTFPETSDLPVIKPRTTVNNKNEFNVAIVKKPSIVADMSLFKKLLVEQGDERSLKSGEKTLKQLRDEIAEKKQLLL